MSKKPTKQNNKVAPPQEQKSIAAPRQKKSAGADVASAPNAEAISSLGVEGLLIPISSSAKGTDALRSSIGDLYRLGANLHLPMDNYHYLTTTISTAAGSSNATSYTQDAVTSEQIWGQLSLLGAPVLKDIGVSIGKLNAAFGQPSASKKGKKIAFNDAEDEEDEDDDDFDDEELDELDDDEELEEEDFDSEEDEEDDESISSESDSGLDNDDHLSRLISSRKKGKGGVSSAEARRQQALLDFAADGDDGENDDEEWAAEFETRKDNDGDDDDERPSERPKPSKRVSREDRLKKKYSTAKDTEDADEDDGEDAFGFDGEEDEEGEEGEEGGDIMAEMYGDEYDGDDNTFFGENEEDEDVHGSSSDEDNNKGDDEEDDEAHDLYDAEEDARYQKGMFPTDNDDGFDNILDDREGQFHQTSGTTAEGAEDEDEEGLTDFQLRQKQEKRFIGELEQKRAFNADWAMTGEVEGRARPKDSLVDEELDFEHGMKSVPVITEALTAKLEDRIKKRIADSNFNDVVRRAPATTGADLTSSGTAAKRDPTLDAEKSKSSLMDLYEKDYLAKLKRMEDAAGMNENIAEPLTEVEKDELKAIQMWKRLAQHLDALSNYYFTPKPIQEDLNVRVRAVDKAAPAISMEAVGAFAASKASAIAPQDTFRPSQKQMLGNVSLEEMTPRERQALRRAKKDASATTKERVERQTADRKKRRLEAEAAKSK